jgi:Na+/H+ antiporter NhaA
MGDENTPGIASKIAIFLASLLAGTWGFVWLRLLGNSPRN